MAGMVDGARAQSSQSPIPIIQLPQQHKTQILDIDEVRDLTRRIPAKKGRKRKEPPVDPSVFAMKKSKQEVPFGMPLPQQQQPPSVAALQSQPQLFVPSLQQQQQSRPLFQPTQPQQPAVEATLNLHGPLSMLQQQQQQHRAMQQ
jgi:hypothetical protein